MSATPITPLPIVYAWFHRCVRCLHSKPVTTEALCDDCRRAVEVPITTRPNI